MASLWGHGGRSSRIVDIVSLLPVGFNGSSMDEYKEKGE